MLKNLTPDLPNIERKVSECPLASAANSEVNINEDLNSPRTSALTYTPLVIKKETNSLTGNSLLLTAAEGPIPAGNALHEYKKRCAGTVELLACFTMYNEDFGLFSDSLSGFVRNYAELLDINRERYEGKIAIVCVADGYDKLEADFLDRLRDYGLFDRSIMEEAGCFKTVPNEDGETASLELKDLSEMGVLATGEEAQKAYETLNLGHCFHARLSFSKLLM